MAGATKAAENRLLKDPRVLEEIDRHLWIESEKVGYDIGFDKAKEDWLKKFSTAWMKYHTPNGKAKKTSHKAESGSRPKATKKRRAKSYIK